MRLVWRWAPAVVAVTLLAVGCSDASGSSPDDGMTAVGSFYPLAFALQRVAGDRWEVVDLTPPGAEAHDVELNIEDRAALEEADLVAYLGDIGFQPQVEAAVQEASGEVVAVTEDLDLLPPHEEGEAPEGEEPTADPHVWLDSAAFVAMEERITEGLSVVDPDGRQGYEDAAAALRSELEALDAEFEQTLQDCRFDTMIVSHEAFGYLGRRYGLEQVGLAGLEPEGEPTADRLGEAEELLSTGDAGAVFYELGGETQRAAEIVASDAGVPALPLATLESQPPEGDYLTVMRENLESLQEGLDCP